MASEADSDCAFGCRWIYYTPPLDDLHRSGGNQPAGSGSRRLHKVPPIVPIGTLVARHECGGL